MGQQRIFYDRLPLEPGDLETSAFPEEMDRLIDILRELTDDGVMVKGIDRGLVDFPHLRNNGEEVYLCWKFGEGEINWWHTIPDGFSGRRNISEL